MNEIETVAAGPKRARVEIIPLRSVGLGSGRSQSKRG